MPRSAKPSARYAHSAERTHPRRDARERPVICEDRPERGESSRIPPLSRLRDLDRPLPAAA